VWAWDKGEAIGHTSDGCRWLQETMPQQPMQRIQQEFRRAQDFLGFFIFNKETN